MKLIHAYSLFLSCVSALPSSSSALQKSSYNENSDIPAQYALGTAPTLGGLRNYGGQITLTPSSPVLTLKYAHEAAGIPFIEIESGQGQIEIKYTEDFYGLDQPYGDGPWVFVNSLSNTFRTETFNVTGPGRIQSSLLQGGQRWQTITLLTNDSICLSQVGFVPTVEINPIESLPGAFSASDGSLTGLWDLGARAVRAACVDAGSQPASWNITAEGALIPGQFPAPCVFGNEYSNYTMSFMTKIARGGTGWRVGTSNVRAAPYFVLTSDYPNGSTFVNTNRTLLPPNTIVAGFGCSIVNQTLLPSDTDTHHPLPMSISENEWYNITTTINGTGFEIYINGTLGAFVTGSATGTWAFGPFSDQVAYVKDVIVTDTANGTILYQNDFMSEDVLVQYGVHSNYYNVCLDGAKRDRVIWIGDFAHTARSIAASTYRTDYILGMIQNAFIWQLTTGNNSGLIATQATLGTSSEYKDYYFPGAYGITDYQLFFLLTLGDYYRLTNDLATMQKYWNQTKDLVAVMETYIDPYSGLLGTSYDSDYFTAQGTLNATAPTALFVLALRQLMDVGTAVDDTATVDAFNTTANGMADAINTLLWNPSLGTYGISITEPNDFSLVAIAFTIRAGVANATRAASSIAALPSLFLTIGYKDTSSAANSNTTQLSPNTQGFLLESLMIANATLGIQTLDVARTMLETFWPKMLEQGPYYTGASWEYVFPDGSPGIYLFTSLNHPWGSAPTYVLTEYVLGVQPAEPGYTKWAFAPLVYGLGLKWVKGTVPTPQGDIFAEWRMDGSKIKLTFEGPEGTTGVVNGDWLVGKWSVNGMMTMLNGTYDIVGGTKYIMVSSGK
ncbi:hypothetical protein B0A55_13698 [Friedmanniomyces simplex]|uniref:Alpha-L-rhamnosidase six-hairpin glycosidase domain-containing protein n=1 Tax=Friedmanniomyces simplex TaxID=329884 RepID=A0A4U0W6W8_9PEZI|nr:hypothetical protein B0A55_13698 [Friedmanniomyces simplex]